MNSSPDEPAPAGFFWRRRRLLGAALLWCACASSGAARAEKPYSEYEVKAAFLFNFIQFIKWPRNKGDDFVIGVLGNDPFGEKLDKVVRGESVDGHRISVRRTRSVQDLKGCQVVFICSSEQGRVGDILGALQGAETLTVGESDQFCKRGGVIGFVMENGQVSFEINAGAARAARLQISSRLLKYAK